MTEIRHLRSEVIGQDFELWIKLPLSRGEGEAEYPVLFALDANRSFPIYATTSAIFETPGRPDAREVVDVGIAYDTHPDRRRGLTEWSLWRRRDFIPEPEPAADSIWQDRL